MITIILELLSFKKLDNLKFYFIYYLLIMDYDSICFKEFIIYIILYKMLLFNHIYLILKDHDTNILEYSYY